MPKDKEIEAVDPRDSQIEQLQKQLDALTDFVKQEKGQARPRKVGEKYAKVMFVDDKPVIAFGQAIDEPNGELNITVTTQGANGEKETKKIGYLFLLNSAPRFVAEVLRQDATETVKHQGPIPVPVRIRVADEANGRTSTGAAFTQKEMVLQQTQVDYVSTVKFMEGPWKGMELTISNESLNP